MTEASKTQQQLFRALKKDIAPSTSLSIWLSDLLGIDQSNAYRRIRGQKELSYSEYLKICSKAPRAAVVSAGIYSDGSAVFGSLSQFSCWESLKKYLTAVVNFFNKALSAKEHHLCYVGRDLPLFFFYSSPILMNYKFNVWLRSIGHKGSFQVPEAISALGHELFDRYLQLNVTELWYSWGFLNQLEQMKYWREMDYLTASEFVQICHSFESSLRHYEHWLETGSKDNRGKIDLGILEFCTMNNGGLLKTERGEMLMNAFQGTHFITTVSPPAIEIFRQHWNQHEFFAQPITGRNVKSRHKFFKRLYDSLGKASTL